MNRQQTTAKGFAILSLTGILCKILSLIYVPIQAYIVGDIGNNVISYGYRIYIFMYSLSTAGLPSSISKMVAQQDAVGNYRGSKKIFNIAMLFMVIFGFASTIILASGAKWVAEQFGQSQTFLMLFTLSPVFIFTSINGALRGYFQGERNMVPTAVSNVVEQFFNSLGTVVFIYLLFHYTGATNYQKVENAAAGSALGTIIGAVCAMLFLIFVFLLTKQQRDRLEENSHYSGPELSAKGISLELFKYILPAIIGAVSTSAADLIDSLNSVPRMTANGLLSDVAKTINGQYTTEYQRVVSLVTFVFAALVTAMVPAISRAYSLNEKKALKHSINSSFKALFIFSMPCIMGFTLFAKPIISFIFFSTARGGDQFLSAWSWTYILDGIMLLQAGVLIGIGKPLSSPVNLIIGMAVKLAINYALLPVINMHGAAIGSGVGWLIAVILNERAIRSGCGMRTHYFKLALRPAVFSVIMGVTWFPFIIIRFFIGKVVSSALIVNDAALIITILAAAYIYAFLIIKSKTLTEEEILNLPMGGKLTRLLRKLRLMQ